MSYILEALKKSEQERNPDKVPDLSTQHQSIVAPPAKRFPWGWVIAAIVLMNIFLVYMFFFQQPATQTEPMQLTNEPAKVETPASETTQPDNSMMQGTVTRTPEPEVKTSLIEESTAEEPAVEQDTGLVASKPAETTQQPPTLQPKPKVVRTPPQPVQRGFDDLPHISELPMSLQSQIPNLNFSTHIYVRDGGSFVIINDRTLSEGMSIASGMVLESIVKQGVVLSYRNRSFTLRSMESWTTN